MSQPRNTSAYYNTSQLARHGFAIIAPCLAALLFSALAFFLFTRNDDFPVTYQPDESSKVYQLLQGDSARNFNHPLLMLDAAQIGCEWFGVPSDFRAMMLAGRRTSAALAASGVFALSLAGYLAAGWVGLWLCGLSIALCPPLLIYAHYFKEEPALVCGIMIAMLGARLLLSSNKLLTQLLCVIVLAAGSAAAASGKYVGAATIFPSVVAILIARDSRWFAILLRFIVYVVFAVAIVVSLNRQAFDFSALRVRPDVRQHIDDEMQHGMESHFDLRLDTPNGYALHSALIDVMPHWFAIGAAAAGVLIWRRRLFSRWGIVVAAFTLTFIIELSYSAIPFPRYALPIVVCFYFLAPTLAAASIATLTSARSRVAVTSVCVLIVVIAQGGRCLNFDRQFYDDSHQRLREWIAHNLPAGVRVGAERYTGLANEGDPWRFPNQSPLQIKLRWHMYLAYSSANVKALADSGVDYVAVAEPNYARFFVPGFHQITEDGAFDQCRDFYNDLFAHGELIWHSVPSPSTRYYANCELRLYRISGLRTAAK